MLICKKIVTDQGIFEIFVPQKYLCCMTNLIVGDISISGDVTFDPNQMTLTCISTGGPATTVTWTRDSTTVTEGTETVLNDPVTAQYTHTLTVIAAGVYTCTVSTNLPLLLLLASLWKVIT